MHIAKTGGELVANMMGQGYTPLSSVINSDLDEIDTIKYVDQLLAAGAMVNANWAPFGEVPETPLSIALEKGKLTVACYLLTKGAIIYPELEKQHPRIRDADKYIMTQSDSHEV